MNHSFKNYLTDQINESLFLSPTIRMKSSKKYTIRQQKKHVKHVKQEIVIV